jgi:hypothetical protein
MSAQHETSKINLACMIVAVGLALPSGLGMALAAEERSADEIIKALKPARITLGLTTSPADAARNAEESKFVNSLRNRPTRSLTVAAHRSLRSSRASISK